MKRVIGALIIFAIFSSCATINDVKHYHYDSVIDLRKYADENFLISTFNYVEKYLLVGIISHTVRFEQKPYYNRGSGVNYDTSKYILQGNMLIEIITEEQMIDSLYVLAKDLGADGIINLKIERNDVFIKVGGLAIQRD